MRIRQHHGYGHGLNPGDNSDLNCPSCQDDIAEGIPPVITATADEQIDAAYRLGSVHRYMGRAMLNTNDTESSDLMDALGESSDTTAGNFDYRIRMCEAYEQGWHDANSALGGWTEDNPSH